MGVFNRINNGQTSSSGGVFNQLDSDRRAREMEFRDNLESEMVQDNNIAETLRTQQEDNDAAFRIENKPLPGRNLPVIGPVLQGLDIIASNPISEAISQFTVPDQPMINHGEIMGGTSARDRFMKNSGQIEAEGAAEFIGQAASPFFVPGAGLGAGSIYRPAATQLTSRMPQGIGQTVAREAAIGAPMGFGYEYAQGEGDLGNAAMYGAAGAVLGGALPLAGRGIQAASTAAGRELVQAEAKPALSTAVEEFMKRVNAPDVPIMPTNNAVTSSVSRVANAATQQAEDAFRRIESPTVGRAEPKTNYYADRLEELFTAAKQEQLPSGREREALEDIWSRMAGPKDPGLDELIERGTPTLKQLERTTPTKELMSKARLQQAQKEVAGVPLPVKSEFDRGIKYSREVSVPVNKELNPEVSAKSAKPKELVLNSSPNPNADADGLVKLKNQKTEKQMQEIEEFNNGAGDSTTFESKITRGKKPIRRSLGEFWEKLKTQFSEDIAPINKLEKDIKGHIPSAEDSFYKSARLYKGVPEKITQFIDQRLSPVVRDVEKAGHNSGELGKYALAVHAKDVNAANIKSGFTNAEIEATIKQLGTPEMEAARQKLVQINKELLDDLVDTGVVSREMRDTLNERWKNYIPLFRDIDDVVGQRTGLSEALANVSSPIKSLKGSEANVIDPLENMVENIMKNINSVERNRVASHITKLADMDPEGKFIRKLGKDEKIEGKNVVSVKENGDNVYYEVEKDVRDAILTLDKESSAWLIRSLSVPASWLRAGATLTPEFMLRNPARDYRNARIVSESGFRLDDYAVGLASSIMGKFGKGKLYQDWVKNLGAYGNIVSEDRKLFMSEQRKVLTQSNTDKLVNVVNPKNIIKLLRSISDISESSTKVGEYRAALRSGATKEEAAYRARDIMDFARAGTSIRQTNKIVAFLNANIQGKSKTFRAFKERPLKTSIKVFQHMAVPTAGIYIYNQNFANDTQKETIKNAPDWQKNTFWLIAVPNTDIVARWPKPFDFAVVANVIERSLDLLVDNDKEAFDGFAKGVIADNALPAMITGIQPLIEGMANYSFFQEGPVIPRREQGLDFEDQYDPVRTSETAKFVAKGVDSTLGSMGGNFRSPRIVDNTIQGLFAGGGKYVTDAVDAVLGGTGAVDRPKTPEKSVDQKPVLRSFLVDSNQGGKATEQLYDLKNKLSSEKESATLNETDFDHEKKMQLKFIDKQTDLMSKIGKEIRLIEKDKELSPFAKRKSIEELNKERNDISKQAIKEIKEW